jgi:hypothetical protein
MLPSLEPPNAGVTPTATPDRSSVLAPVVSLSLLRRRRRIKQKLARGDAKQMTLGATPTLIPTAADVAGRRATDGLKNPQKEQISRPG